MSQKTAGAEMTMAGIYAPDALADPYPLYQRIREVSPVFWDARMGKAGAWMITGHKVALDVLLDQDLYSARRPEWNPGASDNAHSQALRALDTQVLVSDQPDHLRLRSQMTRPFMPRAVGRLRPVIEQVANNLLDAVAGRGEMDFVGDFAMALPSAITFRILGIPLADRDRVWRRILSLGLLIDGHPMSEENPSYHLASIGKYMDYFRDRLAERRLNRTDDLVQALADGWDEGQFASEEEVLGNLMFLLTAGQATTGHQIGNTMLALLAPQQRDVFRHLVANPSVVPSATPEFMRYDCSVQLTKRRAKRPAVLAGKRIGQGEEIFVWLGAAHRDPEIFADPDRIDLGRPSVHNLTLGHGVHYCLGGQLGQTINEIAIQLFLERIRNPKVDLRKVERSATATFRGPHIMPMTFD